jgi:hypothetical protein
MKTNKFLILISVFNLFFFIMLLAGFNNSGDKSISIGYNAKIMERDTNISIIYGDDTVRMVLNRISNNLYLGSTSVTPRGSVYAIDFQGTSGMSRFGSVVVGADISPTENFYVAGTSLFTGSTDIISNACESIYIKIHRHHHHHHLAGIYPNTSLTPQTRELIQYWSLMSSTSRVPTYLIFLITLYSDR